ncbi:serine/threonine protein kinase [Aeoliella sp. ICT_H6.2]|uniref:Serine/threonine protein kinase n=1 Tax=Aeoliella straminimaris TaxID=2954799 RepID=A0A9X2FCL8_9BACT|nr:serine/threonine-protein kinase [Aeoliella straminimaris]MCO6043849.1 serine/threonine protein kinase [Aeoliella straminimaris]
MPTMVSDSTRLVKVVGEQPPLRRKLVGRAGPWQLVRQVAETNLARLYTARPADASESQPVAYMVKMLRKEWWRDTAAIEMFRREVMVGSKVSHPHVVPILSANVRQPPFYATMPLLEGTTLRQRLDTGWKPTLSEVLWVVRQMAEGLAGLNDSVRMVHGDIKPENVMLSSTGHVTLIDLGFARGEGDDHGNLAKGVMGSFTYIAPEVVTSAYSASIASDQYSLGVVMYELLSGRPPFTSQDPAELIALHRGGKAPCIRSVCPELPKPVASIVHTLLGKDPLRRGMSYRELIERLVRLEIDTFVIPKSA